jgi:archaellum component FlaC
VSETDSYLAQMREQLQGVDRELQSRRSELEALKAEVDMLAGRHEELSALIRHVGKVPA